MLQPCSLFNLLSLLLDSFLLSYSCRLCCSDFGGFSLSFSFDACLLLLLQRHHTLTLQPCSLFNLLSLLIDSFLLSYSCRLCCLSFSFDACLLLLFLLQCHHTLTLQPCSLFFLPCL